MKSHPTTLFQGMGKYDAWDNGDFTLDDLVGFSSSPEYGTHIYEKPLKDLVKVGK